MSTRRAITDQGVSRTVRAKPRVVLKTSRVARRDLDRVARSVVGNPMNEAFRLLDTGELRGTAAEVELKMLRYLSV